MSMRLGAEGFDGGDPLEGEAGAEETGAVGVGDFEGVGLGVVEVELDGGGGAIRAGPCLR